MLFYKTLVLICLCDFVHSQSSGHRTEDGTTIPGAHKNTSDCSNHCTSDINATDKAELIRSEIELSKILPSGSNSSIKTSTELIVSGAESLNESGSTFEVPKPISSQSTSVLPSSSFSYTSSFEESNDPRSTKHSAEILELSGPSQKLLEINTATTTEVKGSTAHSTSPPSHSGQIPKHDEDQVYPTTHFLSFEEWKKKKGVDTKPADGPVQMRVNKPMNQRDSGVIGEEMEIDLSFFTSRETEEQEEEEIGKVYKDKFNYASFDCAATIVKTNSEAKGATSILFENKDTYLLNPCSAPNKFVVIELCQDILVDSLVVANLEFFSSTFKKISVSVSETFPIQRNGWTQLGTFDAKDIRDYQTFKIENPKIWAKFVKLEMLEHYGNEFYCPLTIARIHGRTMMQEYKQEESLQNKNTGESIKPMLVTENQSVLSPLNASLYVMGPKGKPKIEICEEEVECQAPQHSNSRDTRSDGFNVDFTQSAPSFSVVNECSLPSLKFDEVFKRNRKCSPINGVPYTDNSKSTTLQNSISTPQPHTGTQESIYKNIMKRLSLLESNATLSVLYIEEQSKLLSNAFTDLEKRHGDNLNNLINAFNSTVNDQLLSLTKLYQTLQLETVSIFDTQKLNHEELLRDAYSQLDQLTKDLQFHKIVGILNFVLLLVVLIYVLLTRDTYIDTDYLENEKEWVGHQKRRLTSLKHGFKWYKNYSDDANSANSPTMSIVNSDEEDELQQTLKKNNKESLDSNSAISDNDYDRIPPTPEYSDGE